MASIKTWNFGISTEIEYSLDLPAEPSLAQLCERDRLASLCHPVVPKLFSQIQPRTGWAMHQCVTTSVGPEVDALSLPVASAGVHSVLLHATPLAGEAVLVLCSKSAVVILCTFNAQPS